MTTRQQQIQNMFQNFADAIDAWDEHEYGNTLKVDALFRGVYEQIHQFPKSYV